MPSLEPIRRNPVTGVALATHERVGEIGGSQLAAAITLTVFLALFPVILVATAVVGFVSSGDAALGPRLIRDFGLDGDAAEMLLKGLEAAENNKASSSIAGFVGFLWTAIGVVGAIQHVCDRAWQVSGRGIKDKLVAVVWLLGSLLVLGVAVSAGGLLPGLPGWATPLEAIVGIGFGTLFFLWTFKVLTARSSLPIRAHLPGAAAGGIGLQLLTRLGGWFIGRQVASSSALYGSIGVVFAVLAYLLLFGRLLVYAVALNVVLHERRHGVVHVEVAVPRIEGEVPIEADRSAVVTKTA
jgi:membrane protein